MTAQAPVAVEPEPPQPLLVIGYGNELRGDDAVGLRAAEEAARWPEPFLKSIAVHQLLPELAEAVSAARAVVFVDAHVCLDTVSITVRPVGPSTSGGVLGHTGDPAWLLELAETLYERRPDAWLIGIPVSDMALGMELTSTARHGLQAALAEIRSLMLRYCAAENRDA